MLSFPWHPKEFLALVGSGIHCTSATTYLAAEAWKNKYRFCYGQKKSWSDVLECSEMFDVMLQFQEFTLESIVCERLYIPMVADQKL